MLQTENITSEKEAIEAQFLDLFLKARELYPDIDDSINISKTFNESNDEVNEYMNLLHQTPAHISTNQITLY